MEKLQEIYLEALKSYVENRRMARSPMVFAKLLNILTELRTLGNINSEMCFSLTLKNKRLPPFLAEIWDVSGYWASATSWVPYYQGKMLAQEGCEPSGGGGWTLHYVPAGCEWETVDAVAAASHCHPGPTFSHLTCLRFRPPVNVPCSTPLVQCECIMMHFRCEGQQYGHCSHFY